MVLIAHLMLVGALLSFGLASVRVASRLTEDPLERVVASAAFVASGIVLDALILGLFGLGANPVVLVASAVVTALLTFNAIGPPAVTLGRQLAKWWVSLHPIARLCAGAGVGAWLAWSVWLMRYPAYDFDNLSYHIPEVVAWMHNGHPGSIVSVVPGWPYAYLPVVNEVLLTWGTGIAQSLAWVTAWPALLFAVLPLAGCLGLRNLRVPGLPVVLAVGGLCAAPMLTSYMGNGANTDFPALVWLVVAGALCAASCRRPMLMIPAVLALGLSVGTKTSTAPLVGLLLVATAIRLRSQLRPLARPLVVACLAAAALGGFWYLRDLVDHGSPTWPYFVTPWGDPAPYVAPGFTFLQAPLHTLAHFGDGGYLSDTFLGGVLAMAAGVLAAVVTRSRPVALAAGAAAVSALFWAGGPDTGAPGPAFDYTAAFHASPRLLMPAVAAAMLAVALASRRGRGWWVWTVVLALVLGLNVVQLFGLGFPYVPGAITPIFGAAVGGIAGLLLTRLPATRLLFGPAGLVAAAAAAGLALALAAPGLVTRHARIDRSVAPLIAWFAGHGHDSRPIYTSPLTLVMLSGSDLQRVVRPIPRQASCQQIAELARSGWVVVQNLDTDKLFGPSTTRRCVERWRPVLTLAGSRVYDARSVSL
jgi:hypothetical protein